MMPVSSDGPAGTGWLPPPRLL